MRARKLLAGAPTPAYFAQTPSYKTPRTTWPPRKAVAAQVLADAPYGSLQYVADLARLQMPERLPRELGTQAQVRRGALDDNDRRRVELAALYRKVCVATVLCARVEMPTTGALK